ncbi:hypothetical protein [Agrobacterium sp. 22094]|uniref:hypothetical protein n=1 Tax=Agrobacterium sp. 22094 TaxID=3453872 RepID=UPI003F8407FB
MKDATVAATAKKLFKECGPSWLEDSFVVWNSAVKSWSVGAKRALSTDDRLAIVSALEKLDEARMDELRDDEDEDER